MPTVQLPDGHAELRDPSEVTEAGSRGIDRASLQIPPGRRQAFADLEKDPDKEKKLAGMFTAEDFDAMKAMEAATVLAFVRSWVYSQPLTPEGLAELPKPTYDALVAAVEPLAKQLRPDLSESTDPDSPT